MSTAVLAAALLFAGNPTWMSPACEESYRADELIRLNGRIITAEVAKSQAQKYKGLGGKSCIGKNQAMLFVFDKPSKYPFWMKDMEFPLDIIWAAPDGKVVTVKSNILPSSYPHSYINSAPAQYVLELKAGRAEQLGIRGGAKLQFNL